MLLYLYASIIATSFLGLLFLDLSKVARKRKVQAYNTDFKPRVLVIVPCKGVDLTLYENLLSIKRQRYENYDVIAVFDSLDDPAVSIAEEAGIKGIVADASCGRGSGKVKAISTAIEKFDGYEVYVIADSDMEVEDRWLETLVAPLSDDGNGLSTMYPRFNAVGGFWSKVKSVWGFVGDGLMGNERTRFGWGGSLAFNRGLTDKEGLDFLKNSRYSISDDICLTKIARKRGLKIAYTDLYRPGINSKDNFGQFLEWSNRQTALMILGYRKILYLGLLFYSAEIITLVSGIALVLSVSPIFILLFLHFIMSVAVSYKRTESKDALIIPMVFMMPFIYLSNLIVASRIKAIRWRGVTYKLTQ